MMLLLCLPRRAGAAKALPSPPLRADAEGFELCAHSKGDNETDSTPLVTILPRKGVLVLTYTYAPWWPTVGERVLIVDDHECVPAGVPRRAPDRRQYQQTDRAYRRYGTGLPKAGIDPTLTLLYSRKLTMAADVSRPATFRVPAPRA